VNLNDVLIHSLTTETPLLYTSASLNESDNKLFFKVINPTAADVSSALNVKGVTGTFTGQATVLTSASALDENSLATPSNVVPVTTNLGTVSSNSNYTFKANSVTVMQLNVTPSGISPLLRKSTSALKISPNPVGNTLNLNETDISTVEIFSLLGESVMKRSVSSEKSIDVSRLKSGFYVVKALTPRGIASATVIKQ